MNRDSLTYRSGDTFCKMVLLHLEGERGPTLLLGEPRSSEIVTVTWPFKHTNSLGGTCPGLPDTLKRCLPLHTPNKHQGDRQHPSQAWQEKRPDKGKKEQWFYNKLLFN
jgi:hypothetical protein